MNYKILSSFYFSGVLIIVYGCIYAGVVIGDSVYLQDIDSGTTSPTGDYRWLDVANQSYSSSYCSSYNYTQAQVQVMFNDQDETFRGTLSAVNLKPNFAYQIKLVGYPGTDANEYIGLVGRWWQEEWDGSAWANGHNLNNKGNGSSPNPNDIIYFMRKNVSDQTSPTGLKYRFTGYMVFEYVIMDEYGNATIVFEANSSYHVLWKISQRLHADNDGPLRSVSFDVNASLPAYDIDYLEQTVNVFGEWERLPVCDIFLEYGSYVCRLLLTEESFHGDGGANAGNWAAAMAANVSFELLPDWDITMDGTCNYQDVTQMSLEWQSTGSNGWIREDITNDGYVNYLDITQISLHWLESWP